jgi:predicted permease
MRLLSETGQRLRALFCRSSEEAEMEEELRFHLEMQAEAYVREGRSPEEARRRAVLEFGGVERVKEEVRDARGFGPLERFARDLGYAARSFRTPRSGVLLSAAVLAVAIGAGTTTFSVVSGVLLRSLPYTAPERLVSVRAAPLAHRAEYTGGATMSPRSVELVLSGTGAFESAAYLSGAAPVLTGLGEPERVMTWRVAPGFFRVLGSRPLLGRTLTAADATEGSGGPVVVSYRFWVSHLGGARDAIGRTLRLDGELHEVVGVMPAGFEFPEDAQLWRPAPPLPRIGAGDDYVQGGYWLVGRLAPGLSIEQAMERLDARWASYAREHSGFAGWGPDLAPLRELLTGPVRKPLLLLLDAVGLVLLVACANVAAVLLARGIDRRRELAIRLSMGATRGRVARQLLLEAVLLSLASAAAGTLLALAGVPLLTSLMGSQLPGSVRIAVDGNVLAATLVASLLTGLLAGVLPALLVMRRDLSSALRDGGAGTGTSGWRIRAGEALVVVQVGLGTVLLAAAALLAVSFLNLTRVEYGFQPERVAIAELQLPGKRYDSPEKRLGFAALVRERAAAIPGALSAAVSSGIPLADYAVGSVEVAGARPLENPPPVWYTDVSPEYFHTLGIPLLRGRGLARGDDGVVVNETLARAYFGGSDPIGRTISYFNGGRTKQIVGVVADTRQESIAEAPPAQLYDALEVEAPSRLKVSVRMAGEPRGAVKALRRAIRSLDPLLPIDRVGVLTDLVSESVARQRLYAAVVSGFACLALLITVLGMYGLAAYTVSRRSREIGIRLAMGAPPSHVRAITLGRGAQLASVGVALGLAGAWWGSKLLESFVYGLSTSDPRIFAAVALLLAAASVAAALGPALRASRIDPIVVLRTE